MSLAKYTTIFIIIASFVASLFFYERIPEQMATHWNMNGEPDSYMKKSIGLFVIPILTIFLYILMVFLPRLDPKKHNILKFEKKYHNFILIVILFLVYVHFLSIIWNINGLISINQTIAPALGYLLFHTGTLLAHSKRNHFIGIKTPWTLKSDHVWDKTHQLGAVLFKTSGLITFFGVIFPSQVLMILLVPLISSILFLFIFSYMEAKKV